MGWEEVGNGSNFWSLNQLQTLEPELAEGSYNKLELYLNMPVSPVIARDLEDELKARGVKDVKVTTSSPQLNIFFRKGFPWLAVIAAVILASIMLAALIVGWKLLTYVGSIAPWAVPWVAIGGIAAVTLLGVALVRRA